MPQNGPCLIEEGGGGGGGRRLEQEQVLLSNESATTDGFVYPAQFSSDSNSLSSSYSSEEQNVSESYHDQECNRQERQRRTASSPSSYRRRMTKGSHSVHGRLGHGRTPLSVWSAKKKRKYDDEECNSVMPIVWLLRQSCFGLVDSIRYWVIHGLAMNLLQRSLKGSNNKTQVFKNSNGLTSRPSPVHVSALESEHRRATLRQSLEADPADVKEESSPTFQQRSCHQLYNNKMTIRESQAGEEKTFSEVESSMSLFGTPETNQLLHWAVVTIECLAVIPIIIIGLCLFYILAIGLFNDIQELLQRFFGNPEPMIPHYNETLPLCPYNPVQ